MIDDAFIPAEAAAGSALMATGLDRLIRRVTRSAVPILMYHSIAPDSAPADSCLALAGMIVRESHFREQMRYVARHYTTISLTEYIERRERGRGLQANSCIVTFDDGFADTRHRALPILEELGLSGTTFVIGSTLETAENGPPVGSWLHELYMILDSAAAEEAATALAELGYGPTPSGRLDKAALRGWARRRFAELVPTERANSLRRLRDALDVPRIVWHMDRSDLAEVGRAGHEIGAHSMSHDYLARTPTAQLTQEIAGSRAAIESLRGGHEPTFCYPFGGSDSYDERTVHELQRQGFICAVTSMEGLNTRRTDPFSLRRIRVTGDPPLPAFVFRLLGCRAFPWKVYGALRAAASRTRGDANRR